MAFRLPVTNQTFAVNQTFVIPSAAEGSAVPDFATLQRTAASSGQTLHSHGEVSRVRKIWGGRKRLGCAPTPAAWRQHLCCRERNRLCENFQSRIVGGEEGVKSRRRSSPEGTKELSPALQRWVNWETNPSPLRDDRVFTRPGKPGIQWKMTSSDTNSVWTARLSCPLATTPCLPL